MTKHDEATSTAWHLRNGYIAPVPRARWDRRRFPPVRSGRSKGFAAVWGGQMIQALHEAFSARTSGGAAR